MTASGSLLPIFLLCIGWLDIDSDMISLEKFLLLVQTTLEARPVKS